MKRSLMSECLITIKVGSRRFCSQQRPAISVYLHAVNYSIISQQPINLSNLRWMDTQAACIDTQMLGRLLLWMSFYCATRNAEVVASNFLFNQPIDSQLWRAAAVMVWHRIHARLPVQQCVELLWWIYSMTTSTTESKITSVRFGQSVI